MYDTHAGDLEAHDFDAIAGHVSLLDARGAISAAAQFLDRAHEDATAIGGSRLGAELEDVDVGAFRARVHGEALGRWRESEARTWAMWSQRVARDWLEFINKLILELEPAMYWSTLLAFAFSVYSLVVFLSNYRARALIFRSSGRLDGVHLLRCGETGRRADWTQASYAINLVGLLFWCVCRSNNRFSCSRRNCSRGFAYCRRGRCPNCITASLYGAIATTIAVTSSCRLAPAAPVPRYPDDAVQGH